jgi:hypothetical protein
MGKFTDRLKNLASNVAGKKGGNYAEVSDDIPTVQISTETDTKDEKPKHGESARNRVTKGHIERAGQNATDKARDAFKTPTTKITAEALVKDMETKTGRKDEKESAPEVQSARNRRQKSETTKAPDIKESLQAAKEAISGSHQEPEIQDAKNTLAQQNQMDAKTLAKSEAVQKAAQVFKKTPKQKQATLENNLKDSFDKPRTPRDQGNGRG